MPRKKQTEQEPKKDDLEQEEVREIIVERKVGFNYLEVTIIMVISILFGFIIGNVVNYVKISTRGEKAPSELKEFITTYNDITSEYYEDIDKEALLDAAIAGMVGYLDDPYSSYIEGEASSSFNEKIDGEYSGIGATVSYQNGVYTMIDIIKNGPADKAGMKENDILKKVDKKNVDDLSINDLADIVKGKKGTVVILEVLRGEEEKTLTIVRNTVEISSVTSKSYEEEGKKIGYLKVDIFAANTAKQFEKALKKLEKNGINSLIIDVRDNPGGHLTQVSEILSLFLNKKQVMYQTDVDGKKKKVYALNNTTRNYPVVVLTNESSASASEILAACMKEVYKAELVGITTYGKGTVQKSMTLKNGDTIKYTTEKWYTPKGNSINEVGVSPTVEVQQSENCVKTGLENDDAQLQKALEVLRQK